jgi:GntR family transcriptional regulator
MLLRVNPGDTEPIFRQIERQIRDAVAAGRLSPGEKLPSHRQLAVELVVNHLTVKRAYDELEREGIIATSRGMGTYVAQRPRGEKVRSAAVAEISAKIADLAKRAKALGMTKRELAALLAEAWEEGGDEE